MWVEALQARAKHRQHDKRGPQAAVEDGPVMIRDRGQRGKQEEDASEQYGRYTCDRRWDQSARLADAHEAGERTEGYSKPAQKRTKQVIFRERELRGECEHEHPAEERPEREQQ